MRFTDDDLRAGPPRLNEPAPAFRVETTHGVRSLEDYCGRWLLFFSHPADFTPVCTSEFVSLARRQADFAALGCELLGLSVDSSYAHIAWVQEIEQSFGVKVDFPIAEDVSLRVARDYGMVHPGESDTSAVRSVFVIDPDGMLRAIQVYPMTTGRSVDELLRLVQALVFTSRTRLVTPEGWRPGQPAVLPPPRTQAEAAERAARGSACPAWFYEESSADTQSTLDPTEAS